MKLIKYEEKQWAKRGRLCYANPYQIQTIHWPTDKKGDPVSIRVENSWKIVLDQEALKNLLSYMYDDNMTEDRKNALLDNAIAAANRYYAKEGKSEKKADTEEKSH